MNDEDHDGHTISLGPPSGSPADERAAIEARVDRWREVWGTSPAPPVSPPVREGRRLDGAARIATERQRQITAEGWTPEHDAEHTIGELVDAAVCYLKHDLDAESPVIWPWPWAEDWWKPSDDPMRNLVRAGALIAAEIDRLTRAGADREDRA